MITNTAFKSMNNVFDLLHKELFGHKRTGSYSQSI